MHGLDTSNVSSRVEPSGIWAYLHQIFTDFQTDFTVWIRRTFVIMLTTDPTTPQVCRYTTLWNVSALKETVENKTTFVTRYFKKLTTGNNVFIVSVIIYSTCHVLQFLHQMFNVSTLLLDEALLKCVFTGNLVFNCCFEYTPVSLDKCGDFHVVYSDCVW